MVPEAIVVTSSVPCGHGSGVMTRPRELVLGLVVLMF